MDHDPLCPALYPNVNGWCMCAFIAGVRADERERAAQRLEAPGLHEEWCVWAKPMPLPGDRCDCYHAECIAAARGDNW